MKLEKVLIYNGKLEVVTGLRIGGSKQEIEIGGIDNTIIRNPKNGEPYIPGSSLKGKIRSLLEWKYWDECKIQPNDKGNTAPCKCGECKICILFGSLNGKEAGRVLFRDSYLTTESKHDRIEMLQEKGSDTEIKAETAIDRLKGKALNSSLRFSERVTPGFKFEFEIVLRIFHKEEEALLKSLLEEGLILLHNDALGASGSRGYGKVKIDGSWKEESVKIGG